jgi:hypothetical protein
VSGLGYSDFSLFGEKYGCLCVLRLHKNNIYDDIFHAMSFKEGDGWLMEMGV